jgi:hypothetical protein
MSKVSLAELMNTGRYVLTVCADGIVSIMERGSRGQRRLGSALPIMGVDALEDAFELIRRLCTLARMNHGSKKGTLLEPRIKGWTEGDADIPDLEKARAVFVEEYKRILAERAARAKVAS